jgi:hypothetical protein
MRATHRFPLLSLPALVLAGCTVGDVGPDPDPIRSDPDPELIEVSTTSARAPPGGTVRLMPTPTSPTGSTSASRPATFRRAERGAAPRQPVDRRHCRGAGGQQPVDGAGGWGGIVVESGGVAESTRHRDQVLSLLFRPAARLRHRLGGVHRPGPAIETSAVASLEVRLRGLNNGGV